MCCFIWRSSPDNWGAIFNPFSDAGYVGIAGLNLYGGVLLGVGSAALYCWSKKMSILDVFDYFAPTLGLGLGLTRVGCFLNGCCFGLPTDLALGSIFPGRFDPALRVRLLNICTRPSFIARCTDFCSFSCCTIFFVTGDLSDRRSR